MWTLKKLKEKEEKHFKENPPQCICGDHGLNYFTLDHIFYSKEDALQKQKELLKEKYWCGEKNSNSDIIEEDKEPFYLCDAKKHIKNKMYKIINGDHSLYHSIVEYQNSKVFQKRALCSTKKIFKVIEEYKEII